MREKKWYKLDNVGKFYASIASKQVPNIFRYSVSLNEAIDETLLQSALDETIKIFPSFNVNLKRGFFWYYLEETNRKLKVTKENLPICFRLYNNSDDFLYRVTYYENRINLEISHILSDGRGSVEFLRMLVGNYLKLKYSLDIDLTMTSYIDSIEDSFSKYYQKSKKNKNKKIKLYSYKNKKLRVKTRYLEAHLSVSKVLSLAHSYDATLTSLLVSALIYSFKDEMKLSDMDKSIKIDIPVDLRKYFKSKSIKNFFGLTSVTYKFNSKDDTFEDVIKSVNEQFKSNLTMNTISDRANKMVAFEKNIFCRIMPVFVKNIVLQAIDNFTSQMSSSCVSNIGKISFDKKIEDYIKDVNVFTSTSGFQFTLCSFKDDLSIGISSKYRYNNVITNFCRFFTYNDIEMTINASEVD